VDPEKIYSSEDGLDMRFSNNGMYGTGIYFADNALYSHTYAFKSPADNTFKMFVCFVLTGDACMMNQPDNSLKLPPLKDATKS